MALEQDSFDSTAEIADVGGVELAPPSVPDFMRVPHYGVITFSVMLATVMQALDATIANVALPRMQGTLSATQDEMGWVLTSYIVASAITIPLTGWLAGQFGRRVVFLTSIFVFTAASALCGLADSLPQIVLFRFLQGVGGAALVPLSQAVLFDINSPKDFGRAMSIWGAGVTMGPILGPALGGLILAVFWRGGRALPVITGMMASLGVMTFIELMQKLAKETWTRWTGTEIFWPWYTLIGVAVTLGVAWATNKLFGSGTTAEDRSRTRMYQENAQRESSRAQTPSLNDFVAGLLVRVEMAEATEDQLSRESRFRRRLRLDAYGHYPLHAEAIRQWRQKILV